MRIPMLPGTNELSRPGIHAINAPSDITNLRRMPEIPETRGVPNEQHGIFLLHVALLLCSFMSNIPDGVELQVLGARGNDLRPSRVLGLAVMNPPVHPTPLGLVGHCLGSCPCLVLPAASGTPPVGSSPARTPLPDLRLSLALRHHSRWSHARTSFRLSRSPPRFVTTSDNTRCH
jgi:hypothetical protein